MLEVEEAVQNMQACITTSTEFLENTVMQDYKEFSEVGINYRDDAGTFEEFMTAVHNLVENLTVAMEEIVRSLDVISQAVNESAEGASNITEKTNDLVKATADAGKLVKQSAEKVALLEELVDRFDV